MGFDVVQINQESIINFMLILLIVGSLVLSLLLVIIFSVFNIILVKSRELDLEKFYHDI